LKYTYMPGVLIETGFLTNAKEGAYLNSARGQNQMATAIAQAIKDYKRSLQASLAPEESLSQSSATPEVPKQSSSISDDIIYRVQLAASSQDLELKPYNFKGLSPVFQTKDKKIFRYFYGESSSYTEVQKLQKEAQQKGYTAAFIVAFRQGKKIPLQKALNAQK